MDQKGCMAPWCLKIIKKVSFNIASEPSNVEILSGQKLIKVPKMVQCASFWKPKASGQTLLQGHF